MKNSLFTTMTLLLMGTLACQPATQEKSQILEHKVSAVSHSPIVQNPACPSFGPMPSFMRLEQNVFLPPWAKQFSVIGHEHLPLIAQSDPLNPFPNMSVFAQDDSKYAYLMGTVKSDVPSVSFWPPTLLQNYTAYDCEGLPFARLEMNPWENWLQPRTGPNETSRSYNQWDIFALDFEPKERIARLELIRSAAAIEVRVSNKNGLVMSAIVNNFHPSPFQVKWEITSKDAQFLGPILTIGLPALLVNL